MITRRPRLLVSVRDADEAQAALTGGADIIDIKEPVRGALGMAEPAVIAEIVESVDGRTPVSAALGELGEWTAGAGSALTVDGLSTALVGLSFVKLGLAGCGTEGGWAERWVGVRKSIEAVAGMPLPWVAVAYADAGRACAPDIADVIDAAAVTGCRGVLIDTFDKRSGSLLDCCSIVALQQFADTVRCAGLFIAFAGRLSAAAVECPDLRCADILGVRSAACDAGDRQQRVTAGRVATLRRSIVDRR